MTTPPAAPLTDAEVAAFRELASKATKGKWMFVRQWNEGNCPTIAVGGPDEFGDYETITDDDFAFAAESSNIADRLASEWEAQKADLSQTYMMLKDATDCCERLQSDLADADARIAELEFSRAEAEALVMSHEGKIDQLSAQLAERDAEIDRFNKRVKMAPIEVDLVSCPSCGETVPPAAMCIRCGYTDPIKSDD